jgi:ABC-2 type transport system permease protein
LAAAIRSKREEETATADSKGVNVIFVADLDMMSDMFRQLELELPEGRLRFDNLSFLLNAVDVLAGDTELLKLRNKRPQRRTLDQIEEILEASEQKVLDEKASAEAKTQELIDKANQSLKEIQRKIDELPSDDNPAMLFRLKVEEARAVQEAEIRAQEIRDEQQERILDIEQEATRERRREERRVQYASLLLPPIPALIMGIVVFFWRRSSETMGAEQSRLRA